jgi:hypothetical protein
MIPARNNGMLGELHPNASPRLRTTPRANSIRLIKSKFSADQPG